MQKVSSKYRIRTEHCTIVLEYFVNQLRRIEIERNESHFEVMAILNELTDNKDATIEAIKKIAKVRELKVNTRQQKIALWCELYKRRYGYNYTVNTAEVSAIKNVDVTVDLINLFLDLQEWWSKEKTIMRYAKNINEIKRIYAGKARTTSSGKNSGTKQSHRADLAREFQRRFGNTGRDN